MPKSVRYLAYVIYMLHFCLPQLTVHVNRELRYRISSIENAVPVTVPVPVPGSIGTESRF